MEPTKRAFHQKPEKILFFLSLVIVRVLPNSRAAAYLGNSLCFATLALPHSL